MTPISWPVRVHLAAASLLHLIKRLIASHSPFHLLLHRRSDPAPRICPQSFHPPPARPRDRNPLFPALMIHSLPDSNLGGVSLITTPVLSSPLAVRRSHRSQKRDLPQTHPKPVPAPAQVLQIPTWILTRSNWATDSIRRCSSINRHWLGRSQACC